MYFNQDMIKNMMDLFANPLFKKGFFDFFLKMQQEGIESAKKFWNATYDKNLFPNASDMFEKMVDFYIILGFVPRVKYDEILKENEKLRDENKFLRDTIKELQLTIFKEGGEKMQEAWGTIIDKQLEMNKEIAKNFFELFKQLHGNSD
ncbi:MAG: hypothetical protein ABSA46_21420 [Thermodesulfovibrionales bacterium]